MIKILPWLMGLGFIVIVLVLLFGSGYNRLVGLRETVEQAWADVESDYQRRYDLIPNLVQTVKGAADFEQTTLQQVVEARSRVGQVAPSGGGTATDITENPEAFARFQDAQASLGSALSRLLVVVERYPELKATQNFSELQVQLEGTENRIAVSRRRYNEAVRTYNATMKRFPSNITAAMFGFDEKQYFRSQTEAETAPTVQF